MTVSMKIKKEKKNYIGSSLEDFLKEENIYAEVNEIALKRVLVWQISEEMKNQGFTKVDLAKKMNTSRIALDRVLDPESTSITLNTLIKLAEALGKKLKIELV